MSRIDPFREVVFPSVGARQVQSRKDRQDRRPPDKKPQEEPVEETAPVDEVGPSHLDLKA